MTARVVWLARAAFAVACLGAAVAARARSLECDWNTVDGGGVMFATGGTYVLGSTIGQPDAGAPLTGGGYVLLGGFWAADVATASPCPGDLNGSGLVDAADLATLLGNWGSPGVGDLDGSGAVGAEDLAMLLGGWGPC